MNNLSIEELKLMRDLQENVENHAMAQALDELIAIRELKGDQVPFAYAYHLDTGVWWLSLEKPKLPGYTEVRELFTTPQKPVVLPKSFSQSDYLSHGLEPSDAYGLSYGSSEMLALCKKAIEAAGGIVKTEEKS